MLEITTMNKGPIPPELCGDRRLFLVGFGRTPSVDRLVRAEKRGGTTVVDDGDFFTINGDAVTYWIEVKVKEQQS